MSEIYLAGGCFWGMEKYIASIRGVQSTQAGYANGITDNPTYEEVCSGNTGHAETVRVVYDPGIITLEFLLELYYASIDPVSVNRQGGDRGVQYRTGIYFVNEADRPVIERSIAQLQKRYDKPIAIEVKPLVNFSSDGRIPSKVSRQKSGRLLSYLERQVREGGEGPGKSGGLSGAGGRRTAQKPERFAI